MFAQVCYAWLCITHNAIFLDDPPPYKDEVQFNSLHYLFITHDAMFLEDPLHNKDRVQILCITLNAMNRVWINSPHYLCITHNAMNRVRINSPLYLCITHKCHEQGANQHPPLPVYNP